MKRTMNRKGSFFVPIVAGVMLLFIILGYAMLEQYFARNDQGAVSRELGSKQAAILTAIQEGERIHAYAQLALRGAHDEVISKYFCGESYLGRRLVSNADCPETLQEFFDARFTEKLSQYPGGGIADSFTPLTVDKTNSDLFVSYAEKRITIEGGEPIEGATTDSSATTEPTTREFTAAGGTFNGGIAGWPTETPFITSYFGNRNIAVADATKNHPGLDIRVDGVGDHIRSLTDGVATFHENGLYSYVQVVSGTLTIDYMHVRPVSPVVAGKGVAIKAGDEIAVSAPFSKSAPHLHLQVSSSKVSIAAAKKTWPGHVGPGSANTPKTSYGVVDKSGTRLFLNPICFFDRAFITSVPRGKVTPTADPYEACNAYEQSFKLSGSFGAANTDASGASTAVPSAPVVTVPESTAPAADPTSTPDTTATPTVNGASPATSKYPYVRMTYANLQKQDLFGFIDETAKATGVDSVLILSIITKESQGVADARSAKGPAGIAQIAGPTAQDLQKAGIFTQVTICCTGEQSRTSSCRALRVCTPENDDRFDPKKSIQGEAALLKDRAKTYEGYDQKIALMLMDYNAGGNVVKQVLRKTGSNPTWDELKSVIQNDQEISYGENVDPASKRKEVIDYVESITQYIPEWGGASLAGTSFSSDRVGFYTVHFSVATEAKPRANAAVEAIKLAIASCTTQDCLDNAIASAGNANGLSITQEPLTGNSDCMPKTEHAQALLANQLAWCKSSPDDDCLCPLPAAKDANYLVSAESVKLIELDGEAVKTETMPGLAMISEGDGVSLEKVKRYHGNDVDTDDEVELRFDSSSTAEINRLILNDDVNALQKLDSDGGLSFTTSQLTDKNTCVLPESFKPVPYCLRATDNSFSPIVFYLKPTLALEKRASLKEYQARAYGASTTAVRASVLSDVKVSYVRVRYIKAGEPEPRDDWLRVVPTTKTISDILSATIGGTVTSAFEDYISLTGGKSRIVERAHLTAPPIEPNQAYTELYDIIVRPQADETMELTVYDEYLNEAGSMTLEPSYTKEDSGVVMSADILKDVVTGAAAALTTAPLN